SVIFIARLLLANRPPLRVQEGGQGASACRRSVEVEDRLACMEAFPDPIGKCALSELAASGHLGDQLDLDAGAERYLGHAEGAPGVGSAVAEGLDQQLRGPVRDQMLLGE